MTENFILEGLQKFLQDNVSPKIKLLRPQESGDISVYELVNPAVHIGWVPPKLPDELNLVEPVLIPCLIVGLDDGNDDGLEAILNIRISFAVYNPGKYDASGKFTPTFDGYKDLLNLITLTKQELSKAAVIDGVTSLQRPFKWGMYQDQPHPYWYGWLSFPVSCAVSEFVPDIAQQYL